MGLKNIVKQYEFLKIVLMLMIAGFLVIMGTIKEGYHMDELIAYEFANSEYTPWIVPTQPQGRLAKFVHEEIDGDTLLETWKNARTQVADVLQNRGNSLLANYKADVSKLPVWIDREEFTDYITVDKTDRYNLLSVYFNSLDDNHPPIYYMVLNIMTSVLGGGFTKWAGLIPNLIMILLTCLYLMKIGEFILEKRWIGFFAAILYGFGMAGTATFLFIRMYAFLTFFVVVTLYLHLKKLKEDSFTVNNKTLIAVVCAGFLSQYFMVFYMLFLAGVTLTYLFLKRDKSKKWTWKSRKESSIYCYLRTMILAAIWGIGLYPASIKHMFFSRRGTEVMDGILGGFSNFLERVNAMFQVLSVELTGYTLIGLGIFVLIAVCAVIYTWQEGKLGFSTPKSKSELTNFNWWFTLMTGVPVMGYFLVTAKIVPFLVDRYVMCIMPILAFIIVLAIYYAAKVLTKKNAVALMISGLLSLCLVFASQLGKPTAYAYAGYEDQLELSREFAAFDCICVYDGVSYYENLQELSYYKNVLLVTTEQLKQMDLEQLTITEDGEVHNVMLLIKSGVLEEDVTEIMNTHGFTLGESIQAGIRGEVYVVATR